MRDWFRRTVTFTDFTLAEYFRSGRFLVELGVLVVIVWVFFWPRGTEGLDPHQFFTIGGIFTLLQAAYTTAAILGMGTQPRGYLILARPLGRPGYLIGLYSAALGVSTVFYLCLTLVVLLVHRLHGNQVGLSVLHWLLGTLPLALEAMAVAAFIVLIGPLALGGWGRLMALALLVFSLSPDLGPYWELDPWGVLRSVRGLLAIVLLPMLSGFQLAVERDYSPSSVWILGGQLVLVASMLGIALLAFKRRDVVLLA